MVWCNLLGKNKKLNAKVKVEVSVNPIDSNNVVDKKENVKIKNTYDGKI